EALVGDLLDGLAAQFAGAALDGPLDVVLGHADLARLADGVAQLEVHGRVAAAGAGGDDDRPAELAPQLAPLGVDGPLLVLDRGPVRVAGHGLLLPRLPAPPRKAAGSQRCPTDDSRSFSFCRRSR